MDYERLTLNLGGGSPAPGAVNANVIPSTNATPASESEADHSMCGSQEMLEVKSKEKARRYWTPSEEERLYEIWGRDNWRLTRNGKNTIFFAKWSEELRERFSVDVKPEEIQMKVNQTRAKFRWVLPVRDSLWSPNLIPDFPLQLGEEADTKWSIQLSAALEEIWHSQSHT